MPRSMLSLGLALVGLVLIQQGDLTAGESAGFAIQRDSGSVSISFGPGFIV